MFDATPPANPIDLAPLREKGLQILRGFFSGDDLELLRSRGRDVAEGVRDGRVQRQGQFALGMDEAWFSPVFAHPHLLDVVEQVLGRDICIALWRVLMKDDHFDGPISIHQDAPYFGGFPNKLNLFIPLTPMGVENGGLVFYEGSHWLGPLKRGAIDAAAYELSLTRVCPELEVGDLLVADFLTWHYSGPAQAPKDRILFQFVYQHADDPSSAHLLRGDRRNPFYTPDRYGPMLEPRTQLNVPVARSQLEAGDLVRAERFARGLLASDPELPGAALLLADVLTRHGDHGGAAAQLEHAAGVVERLRRQLVDRGVIEDTSEPEVGVAALDQELHRVAALEQEIARMKASRSWRWTAALRRR